jgi:Dyp-type peroxidase family
MANGVGKGFTLVMQLQDPGRLIELMSRLDDPTAKARIRAALGALEYVHFARFVPLWEHGLLLVVTEFDGEMRDYVTDFAVVLDDEFSLILSYMRDAPPLPVRHDPEAFWRYVEKNTRSIPGDPLAYPEPFCAYPGRSVLDLAPPGRAKALPARPVALPAVLDRADVQANLLRGVRARRAVHLMVRLGRPAAAARTLLGALRAQVDADDADRNVLGTLALTHDGLAALGLPQTELDGFPAAFREGARLRGAEFGDRGANGPQHWSFGGLAANGAPQAVHLVLSLLLRGRGRVADLETRVAACRALVQEHGGSVVAEESARAFDDNRFHFGYRDGIANPHFSGVDTRRAPDTLAPTGDLLIGGDHVSARGNRWSPDLHPELARNGCYGALRKIEQDVDAFEAFLDAQEPLLAAVPGDRLHRRELLAAKLMGRWRDGAPLVDHPDGPAPDRDAATLDDFDYDGPRAANPDRGGHRCPFGAHVRRTNPRSGAIVGVPWGRSVVRRGLPYGRAWKAGEGPPRGGRGLMGLFLCADLEAQFEFVLKVWAHGDLSAPGLRGTQDLFAVGRDQPTPFRFRPRDTDPEVTVAVPPLVRTRGSLYLFYPGLNALGWLAEAGWTLAG